MTQLLMDAASFVRDYVVYKQWEEQCKLNKAALGLLKLSFACTGGLKEIGARCSKGAYQWELPTTSENLAPLMDPGALTSGSVTSSILVLIFLLLLDWLNSVTKHHWSQRDTSISF